ncbi:MAG: hypothetical protein AAGH57_05450 [Pseudomonadota bacterium]
MRALLIPVLAIACMGASEEAEIETLQSEPRLVKGNGISAFDTLLARDGVTIFGDGELKQRQDYLRSTCRDRLLETSKAEGEEAPIPTPGIPLLRRGPDTPEMPLAIYAVDRREDGCGVMVMMGDINDVRTLPKTNPEDYRVMPADKLEGK